jgi:hypothetical protein
LIISIKKGGLKVAFETHSNKSGAWSNIVKEAFQSNKNIQVGRPDCVVNAGAPTGTAAKVGTLCWDKTGGDAYICTVATGTWVKINA